MKKVIASFLSGCLLFTLTACSKQAETSANKSEGEIDHSTASSFTSSDESDHINSSIQTSGTADNANSEDDKQKEHILIAYFSWADNTVVEDEEAAVRSALSHYENIGDRENYGDVDAVSSASVVKPGNTAKMAQEIQEYAGGDLFPIVVFEPYPDNYDECLDRAADEKAKNARPTLADHLYNMDDYDVVFLGFPNWWYTAPMAVFSFIEEYDLSGKTIIPFCAHGTGGLAASVRDIKAALPDSSEVYEPIGIYRADMNQSQSKINEWLNGLGFERKGEKTDVENGGRKLKMTIDDREITVMLYDTPAANALYEMLPLDLEFEDFNNVEKISYLKQKLPTEGEPDGCDPDVGDLCLYAPWGNLSIFYRDFRYSEGLIMLGHIDSGMDLIEGQNVNFSVTLEATD